MNREEFEKAKVELHVATGPCSNAVNEFFKKSRGITFHDYTFFQIEPFYMKYTQRLWYDQLWRRKKAPIIREFEDTDAQLANQLLYRFQTLCDKEKLSTRNPISFFKSLFYRSSELGFHTMAFLYLTAVADNGFLFDSALQKSVPPIFITRAFVAQLDSSNCILTSTELRKPGKSGQPLGEMREYMQEQIRNFHLMLPNRVAFCDNWEEHMIPRVKKMTNRAINYITFDYEYKLSNDCQQKLLDSAMHCFIWYVSSRRHLDIENATDLNRKVSYLQQMLFSNKPNNIKDNIKELVSIVSQDKYLQAFPFFLYRIFTKFYSKFESGELPNIEDIISDLSLKLNCELKSKETSSQQRFRWNLLLFKQLCYRTSKFLPQGAIERSRYFLEFSEGITEESYPLPMLLDLDATDEKIKEYIRVGKNLGTDFLPELTEMTEYAKRNLELSAFDVLSYRSWDETPQSLFEFMYSSKGKPGSGRGRKKTKRTLLHEMISKLENYGELKERYFQLVFEDAAGYGSGTPTYEWAFQLSQLIDQIMNTDAFKSNLGDELTTKRSLVELSVHQVFLSEFVAETEALIATMGKFILYNNQLLKITKGKDDNTLSIEPNLL